MSILVILYTVSATLLASFMAPLAYNVGDYKAMVGYLLLPVIGLVLLRFIWWLSDKKPHWKFL